MPLAHRERPPRQAHRERRRVRERPPVPEVQEWQATTTVVLFGAGVGAGVTTVVFSAGGGLSLHPVRPAASTPTAMLAVMARDQRLLFVSERFLIMRCSS